MADAVLSLIVFGFLYIFKKPLLFRLRSRVRGYLLDSVLDNDDDNDYDDQYDDYDDESVYPKKTMRDAMDRVFKLGGKNDSNN